MNKKTIIIAACCVAVLAGVCLARPWTSAAGGSVLVPPSADAEVQLVPGTQLKGTKYITPQDTISFPGIGFVNVSADHPNIELSNPKNNIVSFVFTLTDESTGETIAVTEPVLPGKVAYVDAYSYYSAKGSYPVTVSIATYSADGDSMNGINESMTVNRY